MRFFYLFIVVLILASISCSKHTPVTQTLSKTPIVPVDTLAIYEAKMQGIWNWQGTERQNTSMGYPTDTTFAIVDTFGWVVINDSLIAKHRNRSTGTTLFMLRSRDDSTLTFSVIFSGYGYEKVVYNFKKNTMVYQSLFAGHISTTINLQTP